MNKSVVFYKTENGVALMARYVATLTRENVVYRIDDLGDKFSIEVTGY